MFSNQFIAVAVTAVIIAIGFGLVMLVSRQNNLDHIKSKTVGDGQHGTARWATKGEIEQSYYVPFTPAKWRKGESLSPSIRGSSSDAAGQRKK